MKRLALPLTICCLIATNALTSCQQDAYDKGEGSYSLMRADLVEAHTMADSYVDYIITDDGEQLRLDTPQKYSWVEKPDTLYRAVFYYAKKDNRTISTISASRLNVASIVPVDSLENGMKTDPVRLESIWLSKSKRYLNIGLYLKTGQPDDKDAVHQLAIVYDSLQQHSDGKRTLFVSLHHDQGGMPQYYFQRTYFSIAMNKVEADSMHLKMNTFDGITSRSFSLH